MTFTPIEDIPGIVGSLRKQFDTGKYIHFCPC